MDQRKYIESKIKRNQERVLLSNRINQLYTEIITTNMAIKSPQVADLISLVDDYCKEYIYKRSTSKEFAENTLQSSRLETLKILIRDQKTKNMPDNFANYCFMVYKNRMAKEYKKLYEKKLYIESNGYECDAEKEASSKAERQSAYPGADEIFEQKNLRKIYKETFYLYCKALVTSNTTVPRCLALFYARILPNLWNAIKTAASAKWAFERMKNKTVLKLTEDSEKLLTNSIDASLSWGDSYIMKLDETVVVKGISFVMKEVIYTSAYSKASIENMSEDMHKKIAQAAAQLVRENQKLKNEIEAYIENSEHKTLEYMVKGN